MIVDGEMARSSNKSISNENHSVVYFLEGVIWYEAQNRSHSLNMCVSKDSINGFVIVMHDISAADILSADMVIFLHIGIGPMSK